MSTTVDFAPVVNQILELAGVAVATLASVAIGWLTIRLKTYLGQKEVDNLRKALVDASSRGVALGVARAEESMAGAAKVDVKSQIMATGANYLMITMPDTIKKLGMDNAAVARMIEAQLAKMGIESPQEEMTTSLPGTEPPAPKIVKNSKT